MPYPSYKQRRQELQRIQDKFWQVDIDCINRHIATAMLLDLPRFPRGSYKSRRWYAQDYSLVVLRLPALGWIPMRDGKSLVTADGRYVLFRLLDDAKRAALLYNQVALPDGFSWRT